MNEWQQAKRLVVKVGTSTLTHETGCLNLRRIEELTRVLSDIKNSGREILLVSSGAISVGAQVMRLPCRPRDAAGKQAAAAVGQCELMNTYARYFGVYHHLTGQVLLTRDVVDNTQKKENVINTLTRLLSGGVIPVVNENDTVSTEELDDTFGENDTLSAIVAVLVGAGALVMLSDVDGVYTGDPRTEKGSVLLPIITAVDEKLMSMASGAGSRRGTGGMVTKLTAAKRAADAGIPTVVMNGARPCDLYDLLDGKPVGTLFKPT